MSKDLISRPVRRRTMLKAGLALGAVQVASPFLVKALGEEPVKIGLNDPFTGTYAQFGKNEQIGCELAIEEITAKGGILGRQVELLQNHDEEDQRPSEVSSSNARTQRSRVLITDLQPAMGRVSSMARTSWSTAAIRA